jgi:amidase
MKFLPVLALTLAWSVPAHAQATLSDLALKMAANKTSSEALVKAYLKRIAKYDSSGPKLNAIIALNPNALDEARKRDAERKSGAPIGALHGIPILIKDNIESADAMPTTAGSRALVDNVTARDAPMVAKLRAAGAIILGKTNLSEWANIRSNQSTSGWSAVGGLTRNPYVLDRNTCGSSAGSGAAMAAGLAAATIGTETDGSIVCPSGTNGIVGFKPSVGFISRTFVVPISHSQDTPGPMTLSVRDAAMMLTVMAGTDPADPDTAEADTRKVDFASALSNDGLKGKRIGVIGQKGVADRIMKAALARLERAGAVVVPVTIDEKASDEAGEAEYKVLLTELKADMATYLQGLPPGRVQHKTLADLIAFNTANAATELQHFGQDIFDLANQQKGLDDPGYRAARALSLRHAGSEGIDRLLSENKLDLLVAQTNGPAWITTLGKGDQFSGPSISQAPAIAGYPHLTVPMGAVDGLPIGLSFIGGKWTDAMVLSAGFAFEQAGPKLRVKPRFRKTVRIKKTKA